MKGFLLLIGLVFCVFEINAGVIQEKDKAVIFFEDKLNFETNPFGVDNMIKNKEKITIVDVRSKKDYLLEHIPGSINIPGDEHLYFDGNEGEFNQLRKDGYNIVLCYQHLCNLATKAAKKFATLGYPVKEMVGGFSSWKNSGYPVTISKTQKN